MLAYKFMLPGAVAPFSAVAWPPIGEWIAGSPDAAACHRAVHACRIAHLPYWLNDELWQVELDGEIHETAHKLTAERGRLVARVERWGPEVLTELGTAALERAEVITRDHGSADLHEIFASLRQNFETGAFVGAAYVGAVIAGVAAAGGRSGDLSVYEQGKQAEREWQARWIADRVGLRGE